MSGFLGDTDNNSSSSFMGDDFAKSLIDFSSGGVKDADMPSNTEVIKSQEEEIYKAQVSSARAIAFERRKRLPFLIQKGLSKPGRISFDVLRRAARAVHVVRICITVLKEKITKTPWVIQSKDPRVKVDDDKIKRITEFFMYPNQNNETFRSFLDKSLEDLLTLDAVAWEKTRYPDGTLAELHYIDGATIRPIYDEHGQQDILLPFAREGQNEPELLPVSYVQVVDDNPWGGREAGQPVAFWPKKDFTYFNLHPQGDLASFGYGMSPIESVIGVVSNLLAADNFNSTYFEEGAFPPMLLQFKAKMGQRELEQLREYLRTELEGRFYRPAILAGAEDINVMPLKDITQRDMQFMNYMDFMSRLCASAYGLKAQDIGLTDGENYATAKTQKEQMEQQGYGAILSLLKEVFNQQIIWKDFGYTDIEFDWVLTDSIDPATSSTIYDTALKNGSMPLNEVRKKMGLLPYGEWADIPAILTPEGYVPIVPNHNKEQVKEEGHEKEVGGDDVFREESEAGEFSKSIITRDGVYKCWSDDRGVGQPFIFKQIIDGTGYAIKPPAAVNLYSQKLEERWTRKLSEMGLNVAPVMRMTETDIWDNILPTPEVRREFTAYQNMDPQYDSEKWRQKFGGSRKFDYYMVGKYIEGKNLLDNLLIQDMKRVPQEYKKAIEDLAHLWLAEKKYLLGDRRADQVIMTPDKRLWGIDFQFAGNEARWKSTKDSYGIALKQIPELYDYFMKLTGQTTTEKMKKFVKKIFGKASMQSPNPTIQSFEDSPVLFGQLVVNDTVRQLTVNTFSSNDIEFIESSGFVQVMYTYHYEEAVLALKEYVELHPNSCGGIATQQDIRGIKYVMYVMNSNKQPEHYSISQNNPHA